MLTFVIKRLELGYMPCFMQNDSIRIRGKGYSRVERQRVVGENSGTTEAMQK